MTKEELNEIVPGCLSYAQVLKKLNLKPAGGNYITIKKKILDFSIDISHFTGQGWNLKNHSGLLKTPQPLEEILIQNSEYTNTNCLRKRLLNENIFKPECSICSLTNWLNDKIPLELDHINGIRSDNRIENLRLICPNCHSFTETYRGRNIGARGGT